MTWRGLARVSCIVVAAAFFAGCAPKNPHGWVTLDLPAAPLPGGWTQFKDAPSGVSLDAPSGWISWTSDVDAKINSLADVARHVPAGTTHAGIGTLIAGIQPTLFLIDTSEGSLKRMAFSYISVAHANGGGPLSLDGAEEHFRSESSDPIERVELPIGPALKQTVEKVAPFGNGQSTKISSVMYCFIHGPDQYIIRFTADSAQFPTLAPIIDQVMATVRVTAPDPTAAPSIPPRTLATGIPGPATMPAAGPQTMQDESTPPEPMRNSEAPAMPQTTSPESQAPSTDPAPAPDQQGGSDSTTTGTTGTAPPDQDPSTGSTGTPGQSGGGTG